MPATKYTLSLAADFGGSFDSDGWVAEVGASIATPIDHEAGGVSTEGDIIDTWFVSALSPAEEATFLALPASHYPLWREPILDSITKQRERRLATVILAEYPPASGLMFGCSTADQDNWNKLATLDTRGLVAYPFTTHTADHTGSYDLVSSADLTGALGTISLAVLTERNLAETYLAAVVAAPDEASAEAAAAPYLT